MFDVVANSACTDDKIELAGVTALDANQNGRSTFIIDPPVVSIGCENCDEDFL